MVENILDKIVKALYTLPFIEGIVLGGSRATKTAAKDSDIDIGIYYHLQEIDYDKINALAQQLDDEHRQNLICKEGGWGNWVNCGGWLIMDGIPVDLVLRDISRVRSVLQECDTGHITCNYQPGHPHAYLNIMYRGELASCEILYAKTDEFRALKQKAEEYPEEQRKALLNLFLFESDFSCMLAEKYAEKGDAYYVSGHLFRSTSALNQVLFAVNKKYCLNEKKAIYRIDTFSIKPSSYSQRVNHIFIAAGHSLATASHELRELCNEVKELCSE